QAEGRGFKSRLALLFPERSSVEVESAPYWSICIIVMLLSLTACKPDPLGRALKGEFEPNVNNLVILGYCQSCHIHRTLNPSEHLTHVRTLYDRVPYTTTTQCRACHLVSEDTWNM